MENLIAEQAHIHRHFTHNAILNSNYDMYCLIPAPHASQQSHCISHYYTADDAKLTSQLSRTTPISWRDICDSASSDSESSVDKSLVAYFKRAFGRPQPKQEPDTKTNKTNGTQSVNSIQIELKSKNSHRGKMMMTERQLVSKVTGATTEFQSRPSEIFENISQPPLVEEAEPDGYQTPQKQTTSIIESKFKGN